MAKYTYFKHRSTGSILQTEHPEHWVNDEHYERISYAQGVKDRREEARRDLLETLKPGDTVACILRHVSRSGMMRHIDFYKFGEDGTRLYLTGDIAALLDYGRSRDGALKVSGCGMDMGFSVVYDLGRTLWPQGTPEPHGTRNGQADSDGGYALKHDWI